MAFKKPASNAPAAPARALEPARRIPTIELAVALCPTQPIADKIAASFGLNLVDFGNIKAAHVDAFHSMRDALSENLGERGIKLHLERLVGALVSSAVMAGEFYTQKVTAARDLTSQLANDDRDEDRPGVAGFESKAQRAREFAADMGLQAFAQLAAAIGGAEAFKDITGDEWKPFVSQPQGPAVSRQAAQAQLDAFGG